MRRQSLLRTLAVVLAMLLTINGVGQVRAAHISMANPGPGVLDGTNPCGPGGHFTAGPYARCDCGQLPCPVICWWSNSAQQVLCYPRHDVYVAFGGNLPTCSSANPPKSELLNIVGCLQSSPADASASQNPTSGPDETTPSLGESPVPQPVSRVGSDCSTASFEDRLVQGGALCPTLPSIVIPDQSITSTVTDCFRAFRAAAVLSPGTAAFLQTLDSPSPSQQQFQIRVQTPSGFLPQEGATVPDSPANASNGTGSSSTIYWSTSLPYSLFYTLGLPFAPTPCAVLLHELTHARDATTGTLNNTPVPVSSYSPGSGATLTIPQSEIAAMTVMNRYLKAAGYNPVTKYAVQTAGGSAAFVPLPPSAINPSP
jgi:Effector protein